MILIDISIRFQNKFFPRIVKDEAVLICAKKLGYTKKSWTEKYILRIWYIKRSLYRGYKVENTMNRVKYIYRL